MNLLQYFLNSIPLLLQFYAEMYRDTDFQNTKIELESQLNVPVIKTYDFVIVGGGSAGSVLAARLSEQFDVLVLEAGGPPPPAASVPYLWLRLLNNEHLFYDFRSVPQTNVSLRTGGIMRRSMGKMLGGSGSNGAMAHLRGSPKDYDNWASIVNDESFNYTNVLKYFRRMENFVGHRFGDEGDEYYGDGPIVVDTITFPLLNLWFEAGRELGYRIGDPNGFQRESFTPYNMAVNNGRRSSSYAEYIKPHEKSRDTLTIIPYANVSEILLNDEREAYGVIYTRHGFPQIAYARNEVILSAGTFSSPLLLMKSGIGPVDILNAAQIPVKVPLEAVGKHLQEQTEMFMWDFSVNDTSMLRRINSSETEQIVDAFHNGTGALTSKTIDICHSWPVSSKGDPDWPDLRVDVIAEVPVDEEPRVEFNTVITRPKSFGSITMDTGKYRAGIRDDVQLALIDYRALTHPGDIEVMLEGLKFIFTIMETQAFRSINTTFIGQPDPACNNFEFLSDDYWRCKIQYASNVIQQATGTCRMGPESGDSNTSVVDSKFRVRGVSNLRVVDASVFPEITNANINAPTMMLAEKAAEEIINFYNAPGLDRQ